MSPSAGPASWQRLGELLKRRRFELDPKYQNRSVFCAERGLDYRLAYDIEEARRTNFRTTTLAGIAAAYGVTLDSLYDTLAGGELEPLAAPARPRLVPVPDAAFSQPAPDEAALQEWLTILRRSDPELMRGADPVIEKLLSLPHPDGPEGRLRPFRERETLVRALLGVMSATSQETESNSGTDG